MSKGTMQRLTILGRLGTNPEIKDIGDDRVLAKLNIATTDRVKQKGSDEWEDITTWHNVTAFGQVADFAKSYLKKGDSVYVEAKLRPHTWQAEDGSDRYAIDIVASSLQQVGKIVKSEEAETSISSESDPLKDIQ